MRHRSEELDKLIGKIVKINFFDDFEAVGTLEHNKIGKRPYLLVTREFDISFYKTHIKKVSVLR